MATSATTLDDGLPYGLSSHLFQSKRKDVTSWRSKLLDTFKFIVCELEKMQLYFDTISLQMDSSSMTMLQHLKEFEEHLNVSLDVLENKSKYANDLCRRIMECFGSYASKRLCFMLCDVAMSGCCVEVYRQLIQLQREKKLIWNEVEGLMLARCICLFESDCDFQDVMTAHDDVSMCIGIIHCFSHGEYDHRFFHSCRKCKVSSMKRGDNPLLNVCLGLEPGMCIYTTISG